MRNPILVTGSHKSGTTWTGKVLALSDDVGYLSEPFNPNSNPSNARLGTDYWFKYITEGSSESKEIKRHLESLFEFNYPYLREFKKVNGQKDLLRFLKGLVMFNYKGLRYNRPLMKDPIAIMSADWLYEKFDMDVIVLIRHPASFVSSMKKYGMDHPFEHFAKQKNLLKDKLAPFKQQIRDFADHQRDLVEQGILLWKIIYSVIEDYRDEFDAWSFIKQEDLASNPLDEFEKLYKKLGLDYTKKIKSQIVDITKATNPVEIEEDKDRTRRNSKAQIKIFRERLTQKEIKRVKNGTSGVWEEFYGPKDW